jgi:MFS family permease
MILTYSPAVARRIAATLFITQSLGSAALIANATVNPIVGARLSGQDAWAGLPSALLLLGAASAAYPAGRLMEYAGRRVGLAAGFFVGLTGMLIGGTAILMHSFPLFLLGLILIGGARGAVDQSRYAAADAQIPERRAKAISAVVFAGTIGAILGPALVAPSGNLLGSLEANPLAGPMWSGALLFALSGVLITALLRPDPRDIARVIATRQSETTQDSGPARSLSEVMRLPDAQLALVAMVFGQVIMVLIMTVTSLHMHHHDHGLGDVSLVMMAHTMGMFGLSVVNGALIDRVGRKTAIAAGAILLIVGSLTAPLSLMTAWLALALFIVGLGWNLCYIAGSSLLSDVLAPAERARIQGANELAINLSSAISSLSSGFILAALSYGALGLAGAVLSLVPLALLVRQGLTQARVVRGEGVTR